jgi:hypothetical protein
VRPTVNANAFTVNAKHKREPTLSRRNDLPVNALSANVVTYISSGNLQRDAMPKHVLTNFKFTENSCEHSGNQMFNPAKHFAQ